MLRLTPKQRAVAVEKLPDLANIAAGFFVFGQFVGDEPTSDEARAREMYGPRRAPG